MQPPHAHDAWLDVWLQLGILGLIVFGALVLATLVRSWLISVDRVVTSPGDQGSHIWLSLLPMLMLTAQLVQSIAESRIVRRASSAGFDSCRTVITAVKALNRLHAVRGSNCS